MAEWVRVEDEQREAAEREMNSEIENVLAALDGFRMCDQIDYAAYSQLHDLISELDIPGKNGGKWISVKDGLPEECTDVLVFNKIIFKSCKRFEDYKKV